MREARRASPPRLPSSITRENSDEHWGVATMLRLPGKSGRSRCDAARSPNVSKSSGGNSWLAQAREQIRTFTRERFV